MVVISGKILLGGHRILKDEVELGDGHRDLSVDNLAGYEATP
jgi:hypothetical protein